MTYKQLQMPGLGNTESTRTESPSCQRAFRVSPIHLQEKVKAMVTSVTCGEKLQDASEKLNRAGSLVKIRPVCLPELISGTSNEYLPTLPRWGIACHGEYGALVMSERLTSETGCSLLPTPTASESKGNGLTNRKSFPQIHLYEYVALYPTPQATSWGCSEARAKLKRLQESGMISEYERKRMQSGNGGKLNPTWVEWLMGFPTGWSDSSGRKVRYSPQPHDGRPSGNSTICSAYGAVLEG